MEILPALPAAASILTDINGPNDPLELAFAGYLSGYKGSTFENYRRDLLVFLTWCGDVGLPPLAAGRPHLQLYIRWLEQTGWATSTIARRFGTVAGFYGYCTDEEIIVKNPSQRIKRPLVDRDAQRRTVLTALEYSLFLAAARQAGTMEHCIAALLGMRGLRISEACQLDVTSVTIKQGYEHIAFVRKGGKQTDMVLPVPVARAVRAAIADRTDGPLLLNSRGRRMDRAAATRLIKRVCKQAGIKTEFSPHSFRRTFASTSLAMGIPLRDVQEALNHRSPNTTAIYDRRGATADRDAAHRLASYIAGIAG